MKKGGKTSRPLRYVLNQIPYNYAVEVTNRFRELDLVDRVPEELWTVVHSCTVGGDQNHPKEKEMQEDKVVI